MWVTVGEPVFLHIHTCSIFRFSRRAGVYKILVMAVHRARARAANAPTAEFPSFFRFSTSQKGAFHQIVKKSRNLPYKKRFCFLKGTNLYFFACGAHGQKSAVPGHAAVPTHTCTTATHSMTCGGLPATSTALVERGQLLRSQRTR